ncbi:hypothetical protein PYW08_014341 [Mythimna loreyi]|uniref:Uncharacterized protein n=1 Tax=Mythimna loreyi TaxID=667449 RepID=A0ACC2R9W0_9NEOP|nr:hypothetical protein PYW08_014341 [Mythimna loreyi]
MKKLIYILCLIKCISGHDSEEFIANTAKGKIKGLKGDGDYAVFLGVPYALVDESNPFGAATPHPGFNSTYEAIDDSVSCPQYSRSGEPMGTIQCLQLNIYVPSTASSNNKLPVMVYIHGGSFVLGSKAMADLSPKFLIRHDVVIVSINYRLGPYGFLCISEPGFSNQGLKDQVLALKWIKDNIEAFGGDSKTITAFGQSAGAMTLDVQLLTNENLVQRAIMQSGSALTTWVIATQNDSIPLNIAGNLGYDGDDVKGALDYLSNKDPLDVMQATHNARIVSRRGHPLTRPCVETVGEDAHLTDFPVNLQPKVSGMDLMIGHTNKEVMFLYPKQSDKAYYENYSFGDELIKDFDGIYDEDTIRHFYVGDQALSSNLQSDIFDFGTDFVFCYPTERTVDRYLKAKANKVYRYVFSYEGGRNRVKISLNFTSPGACHGDDLGYLFDMNLFANKAPNKEDQRMIDTMTTMWTNFAKYGDPTPVLTDLITVQWHPAEASRRPYMLLNKPITLEHRPFYKRMAFWELYYKLHGNKEKGYKGN